MSSPDHMMSPGGGGKRVHPLPYRSRMSLILGFVVVMLSLIFVYALLVLIQMLNCCPFLFDQLTRPENLAMLPGKRELMDGR